MSSTTFKYYNTNQLILPLNLEILISDNHISRIVDKIIEKIDLSKLRNSYGGGGAPSYDPKMMLKVIVYAYTQRKYSSRTIEKELKENIYFMWLSGKQEPCFKTIASFVSSHLDGFLKNIFIQVNELLISNGYFSGKIANIDGTKVEANANKFTFVWKNAIKNNEKKLDEKYKVIIQEIKDTEEYENKIYGNRNLDGLEEVDIDEINKTVEEINDVIASNPKDKRLKKALETLKEFSSRKLKYQTHKEILGNRNSFSKTDHDATFMRMKDDYMQNGQLKPGYNVQIATQNQFVLDYLITNKSGDTTTLIPFIEAMKDNGYVLDEVVADAGYGSEENYKYLEKENMKAFVKYNTFDTEEKEKFKKDISKTENMTYDEEHDYIICHNNRKLIFNREFKRKTDTGFERVIREYTCTSCNRCKFKKYCLKNKQKVKTVTISIALLKLKDKARNLLNGDIGKEKYRYRKIDVEPVFGMIKSNRGQNRFRHRGSAKVGIEWGLLCCAHNILKKISWDEFPDQLKIKEQILPKRGRKKQGIVA